MKADFKTQKEIAMDSNKTTHINTLKKERDNLISLVEWHEDKCFVFADIKIEANHPMHSQLLAVFQNRLKYINNELEGVVC